MCVTVPNFVKIGQTVEVTTLWRNTNLFIIIIIIIIIEIFKMAAAAILVF